MAKTSQSKNLVTFFSMLRNFVFPQPSSPPPPPHSMTHTVWYTHRALTVFSLSFSPAFQTTLHVCNGATEFHVHTPQTRCRGWRRQQSASREATNVCWHQQQHSQCQCGWRRRLSYNRRWTWISHRCLCCHLWKQCYSSPGYILWPGKSLFSHIYIYIYIFHGTFSSDLAVTEMFEIKYVTTSDS